MTETKTKLRTELTADGFYEVWRGNNRISDHPFVNLTMAQGYIKQVEEYENRDPFNVVTYGTVPFVPAQGTEAQRAETSSGSVHDGPVAKPCAQTKGQSHVR